MARLILLDRDGVINFDSPDFIKGPGEWKPIPGSLGAIARLNGAGFLVGMCSNQSGVGRGIVSAQALEAIHGKLLADLARVGGTLDDLRWCPHLPDDGCRCRKPQPGMLLDAMAALGAAAADTIFIGDAIRDVEAAHAAGCAAGLVRTGGGRSVEALAVGMGVNWVGDDLEAFADWLLETGSW
jgi:D-glycero-D-manno-heptose 1,7-bisphosphate phosphatase